MTSVQDRLKNLEKTGTLRAEPTSRREIDALVLAAGRRLKDAQNSSLDAESRFILAYDAAHSFALAALRLHGYRSTDRYTVFNLLDATVSFPPGKYRFLADCHGKRNLALYEGGYEADERLLAELIAVTNDLFSAVAARMRE